MKYLFYLALAVLGFWMFACEDKAVSYDKGYEAAWEGENEPSFWASKTEKEGYEDGLDDTSTYDTGYYDGYDEKRPQYFNDSLYMAAYKDGKQDKKRR